MQTLPIKGGGVEKYCIGGLESVIQRVSTSKRFRPLNVVYTWVNVINTCNAKGWGSEGEYIYVVRMQRVHCSRSKQS